MKSYDDVILPTSRGDYHMYVTAWRQAEARAGYGVDLQQGVTQSCEDMQQRIKVGAGRLGPDVDNSARFHAVRYLFFASMMITRMSLNERRWDRQVWADCIKIDRRQRGQWYVILKEWIKTRWHERRSRNLA